MRSEKGGLALRVVAARAREGDSNSPGEVDFSWSPMNEKDFSLAQKMDRAYR